ncbi:MAG: hypothetical protein COZ01_05095 [Zetaproteobacteria bacterium CG_4_10_14_0_8_um_filter_55_43]|nr:MAG: hypothetical protein COZ01_05095 [Zetaproteobacteria bacterium CG_4_10_14_0_8_um_filter_55_43]
MAQEGRELARMKKTLLLGAGFSYDLGMPLTTELTDTFLDLFSEKTVRQVADVLSQNDPYSAGRPINRAAIHQGMELLLEYKRAGGRNYEELLTNLESLGDLPQKSQSDRDSYHYLFSVFYQILTETLVAYQVASYEVLYQKSLPLFAELESLLNDKETWVFSLNHDLYLECLAIDLGIPVCYGDTSEIVFPINNLDLAKTFRFTTSSRKSFVRAASGWFDARGINLVRLHGGLAEHLYSDKSILCNPPLKHSCSAQLIEDFKTIESMGYFHSGQHVGGGKDRVITGPDGTLDIICRAMLTGGHKYSKTTNPKKGEEKLALFEQVLRDTDELTVIGYSFGDPHVNYRVLNAMVLNAEMKIRIVDPVHRPKPEFLGQFDYNLRVRGAQCRGPEWMSYVQGEKWDVEQSKALKDNEMYRNEITRRVRRVLPR